MREDLSDGAPAGDGGDDAELSVRTGRASEGVDIINSAEKSRPRYTARVALGNCGATAAGIFGNDNPWIIGGSADRTSEGLGNAGALYLPMRKGSIDSLRISTVRR